MIKGYEQGADITLLDTLYQHPKKDENGKYGNDVLTITYEDNITKKKHHIDIENPDYEFYKIKDDIYLDHNLLFAPIEDCEQIVVPYKNVLRTIAQITDNEKFFFDNINNNASRENERLHTIRSIMNSDMNIEDHYRVRFSRLYKNQPKLSINKAFFDIETDNILDPNDFPELGMFPINALSYIDLRSKKVNVMILRKSEKPNPQIKEFEDNVKRNPAGMINELREFVINHVGEKKAKLYGITEFSFEYFFFDEEIALIATFFEFVNRDEPDFLLAWNMPFDIPYIVERIKELGYNPEDIMCHPEYKFKYVHYYIDNEHSDFNKKTSFFKVAGKTVYVDQLVNFASRRSGTKFMNYKLDYIGDKIAKVRKLDYSHITTRIPELPYKNFKTFIFYNVMDTIAQYCIEFKTKDVDYMYKKCNLNFTRYDKCHRQTIYLTNRAVQEFYNDGFIIGNNCAKFKGKDGKYPGAVVHDPKNTADDCKIRIGNHILNMIKNGDDFDFKSLYPSEALQHNIGANTQIGMVQIENPVHPRENVFNNDRFNRGGVFLEDYQSGNIIEFCKRWLHFAGYMSMMKDVEEYLTFVRRCQSYQSFIYGDKLRQMVIPDEVYHTHDMVNIIRPENNVPKNMICLLHQPLSMETYQYNFRKENIG